MAKRLTVFYSWQSDSPSNLNRSFIEKAIQEALNRMTSDATLESAFRVATVELDKDTKGVAGSPPIAETILGKIEECAVFVADLSFVGESKNGFTNASGKPRQFANPNVLIEYGYALHCHSHGKLIGVMNTAYGKPDAESLPFDLRHLRWPICYHLADSSSPDKSQIFGELVKVLTKAVGLILSNHAEMAAEKFIPQKSTNDAAVFFEAATDLVGDRSEIFTVPNGAKAYLRLYPSSVVEPLISETAALDLAVKGNLQPMGRLDSYGYDRNIFGALVRESPVEGKLYQFTQLFLSREIWGVEAGILNLERLHEQQVRWKREGFSVTVAGVENFHGHIATGYIEKYFVETLRNYIAFAQTHLRLSFPLQIEAGLVGIKGYPLAVMNDRMVGKSLQNKVHWQGQVTSDQEPAWEVLAQFFDRIWDNCGFQRTAQQQAELAKGFGG